MTAADDVAAIHRVMDLALESGLDALSQRLHVLSEITGAHAIRELEANEETRLANIELERQRRITEVTNMLGLDYPEKARTEAGWDMLKALNPNLDGVDSFDDLADRLKVQYYVQMAGVLGTLDQADFEECLKNGAIPMDLLPKAVARDIENSF